MKLSAARLASDKLELALPNKRGGEPHLIVLSAGVNVHGAVDTDDGVDLDHIGAESLTASRFRWSFGATTLELGPLALRGVEVDLHIPKEGDTHGVIAVAELDGPGHEVALGDGRGVRVDRIVGRDVSVKLGPSGVQVEARVLELHGVSVRLERVLPHNVARSYEELVAASEAANEVARPTTTSGDAALLPRIDWRFLDTLDGKIAVDVALDVAVPVIGHRLGRHPLRVPIERGVLDFKKLEHSLAAIEDQVIDFELEPGRLILEQDVPLLGEKTLLYWPLDPEEQALAKADKVRLSTLMGAMRPAKSPDELAEAADDLREKAARAWKARAEGAAPEKDKVRLLGVDLDDVDVQLAFGVAAPEARAVVAASGRIAARGGLRIRAEGEPPAPAELEVRLQDVRLGTSGVPFGDGTLAGHVRVDADTITLGVTGAAPQSLLVTAGVIALGDVSLGIAASRGGAGAASEAKAR